MAKSSPVSAQTFLAGGGECGERIRAIDWAATSLGPVENWPQSLRTSVSICLNSNFPICIYWGEEHVLLYNESWAPIPGNKHPWALGKTAREAWPEIWEEIRHWFADNFRGKPVGEKDTLLFMNRHGYTEECFFDFTFTPIYSDDGRVGGVFNAVIETTYRVLNERRNAILQALNKKISTSHSVEALCLDAMEVLVAARKDLPFALLYLTDDRQTAGLAAASFEPSDAFRQCGLDPAAGAGPPESVAFCEGLRRIWSGGEVSLHLTQVREVIPDLPPGIWPEPCTEALVLPLTNPGGQPDGFLVAGISARRALDTEYTLFLENVAADISIQINRLRALDEERRRAEMLAELDRGKTAFFSNISHEFRTPLTLILGPLEELLRRGGERPGTLDRSQLEAVHRNALRLLRLVNMLLDFSRIEAGRMNASFHPTDLAAFTADLASTFRSAIEAGGLYYRVEVTPLDQPAYIDAPMWEKIVFNLISNALKYTLQGEISVSLGIENDCFVLRVQDTGTGIPAAELPHIFERFHRVQGAAGRTHEGTGIGLSLVRELVHLHGGEIGVESREGTGTTFTVRVPCGDAHLPADKVKRQPGGWIAAGYPALLAETPPPGSVPPVPHSAETLPATILVVDDNADMRAYIQQLLAPYWYVETAVDGRDAWKKIQVKMPELVLSDVMMPEMDGTELLRRIKNTPSTAMLPVILVSARAGEEARIEGYEAGADDYLVKPFSANELLARVRAQMKISRAHRQVERQLRDVFEQAPVAVCIFRGPAHVVEMINPPMLRIWDRTLGQIAGKPVFEAFDEAAGQGFEPLLDRVYQTGERYAANEVSAVLTRNGKTEKLYVNILFEPFREPDGQVTGIICVATEVTEHVLARQKVEAGELEKAGILNSLNAHIAVINVSGEIIMVNEAWERFALENGATSLEGMSVGENYLDVLHNARGEYAEEAPFVYEGICGVIEGRFPLYSLEYPCHSPSQQRWFLLQVSPLTNDGGGAVISHVNITERRLAEEALRDSEQRYRKLSESLEQKVNDRTRELAEKNAALEKSNRDLEQFAHVASHDLQEPLRKLQTFSNLLLRHLDKPAEVEKYAGKISASAHRMSQLIQEVLNYSRMSQLEEKNQLVDLNRVLENVIADFDLAIREKNAVLEWAPGDLPTVRGNSLQMHQLFANLLSNALKFSTEQPRVRVGVHRPETGSYPSAWRPEPGRVYSQLVFQDNGIGFEPEHADKIFGIFQRLHDRQTYSGSGIGLALCKKIVENHGGAIVARGEPEQGATFYIYLPVEQP